MEEQVNQSLKIAASLIVTAALICVVSTYSYFSYFVYNNKVKNTHALSKMTYEASFHAYDNKTVNGSDILSLIGDNTRLYKFEIVLNGAGNTYDIYEISSAKENEAIYTVKNSTIKKDLSGNTVYVNGGVVFNTPTLRYDSDIANKGLKLWDINNIRENILGDNEYASFSSRLITDVSGEAVIGIQFIQGEVG